MTLSFLVGHRSQTSLQRLVCVALAAVLVHAVGLFIIVDRLAALWETANVANSVRRRQFSSLPTQCLRRVCASAELVRNLGDRVYKGGPGAAGQLAPIYEGRGGKHCCCHCFFRARVAVLVNSQYCRHSQKNKKDNTDCGPLRASGGDTGPATQEF